VAVTGDENQWWKEKGLDPIAHAVRLWWGTRHGGVKHPNKVVTVAAVDRDG
jgi:hypothetical protein